VITTKKAGIKKIILYKMCAPNKALSVTELFNIRISEKFHSPKLNTNAANHLFKGFCGASSKTISATLIFSVNEITAGKE
jgi:hypothetical protein